MRRKQLGAVQDREGKHQSPAGKERSLAGRQEESPSQSLQRTGQAEREASRTRDTGVTQGEKIHLGMGTGPCQADQNLPNNLRACLCISEGTPANHPSPSPAALTYQHFQVIATEIQLL